MNTINNFPLTNIIGSVLKMGDFFVQFFVHMRNTHMADSHR